MRSIFVFMAVLVWLMPAQARAWGAVGHKTIAAIAWDRLSPEARRELRGLALRRRASFSAKALWADEVRQQEEYAWSRPLHYLNVERGAREIGRPAACDDENRGCVLSAIERFEGVLADPRAPSSARREAVAFLIHLVGDIHQPLHCGYGDDRGGNDVHLNFRGAATNLHRLWDDQLIEVGGSTWRAMARRLGREISSADAARWTSSIAPTTWAQESLDVILGGLYPDSMEVSDAYVQRFYPEVEQRLSMAGVRLAALLERALAGYRRGRIRESSERQRDLGERRAKLGAAVSQLASQVVARGSSSRNQ